MPPPLEPKETYALPASTCAYERYDPVTLEPANQETYVRLQELGWLPADFNGRKVLDIGCNSGLLTMHALRLGAIHVHACDVQPPLVEFVTRVVAARKLPVKVEKIAFDKLDPASHKADVVLFMEVLHWAVSQGLELSNVIERLAALTGHLLYLEFPWSIKEPSIQKQTTLTEEVYSADTVLDELTRYFCDVRVVRFMRYFGFGSGSKRVLIKASGKRPEASILARLPGTYSLDLALSRGNNESYLLASAGGPLVAKLLARESLISRLPEDLRNQMFDAIADPGPKTLVVPIKHGGEYLLPAAAGRFWMLFPFIGRLPSAGKPKLCAVDLESLLELFLNVRRDFRPLPRRLIDLLHTHGLFLNATGLLAPEASWRAATAQFGDLTSALEAALHETAQLPPTAFDALCHGDLQTGNLVPDGDGRPRVVDLDNLCVGTIYSDGLTGLIWRGARAEALARFCESLKNEESRAVARYDVSLAVANGMAWCSAACKAIRAHPNKVVHEQVAQLSRGFSEALQFASALPETATSPKP